MAKIRCQLRWILVSFAVLLVIAAATIGYVLYCKSGESHRYHQLVQFMPNNDEEVRKLIELQKKRNLLPWTSELRPGQPAIFQFPPDNLKLVSLSAQVLDMPFVLLSSNVEEYRVHRKNRVAKEFRLDRASDFDLNRYHKHTEIEKYLIKLADEQSERLTLATYGTSFEARQLYYVRIFRSIEEATKNKTKAKNKTTAKNQTKAKNKTKFKKIVFIECGAHSREWLSPAVCLQIINSLVHDEDSQPLLEQYEFYILPLINPDGYAYTWTKDRLWRKNRRRFSDNCTGVDLNRNFNIGFTSEIPEYIHHFSSLDELDKAWNQTIEGVVTVVDQVNRTKRMAENGNSKANQCGLVFPGERAFSENETFYLKLLMDGFKTKPSVYISLHTFSRRWLYPSFIEGMISPMDERLRHYAKIGVKNLQMASRRESGDDKWEYGRGIDIMYKAGGTSIDWAHKEVGIPLVYLLEMRDSGKFGFLLPDDQIKPAFREVWSGLSAMLLAYAKDTEPSRT